MIKKDLKILIVEDSAHTSNIMRIVIAESGYNVFCAANTQQATEVLSRNPIDLILLDIMLPGTDGLTFCTELRNSEKYKDIPVVFCTAKGERDDIVKAIKAGGNDYIIKPFSKDILLSKIAKVLDSMKPKVDTDITKEIEDM